MVLARHVFHVKWGQTQQVVDGFKQSLGMIRRITGCGPIRILTDLTGPFHTVIQEFELESIADWERGRSLLFNDPEFLQLQREGGGEIPFEGGHLEFYTIEAVI